MELIITNRKGQTFKVLYDECDHDIVSKYKWYISTTGYVVHTLKVDGRNTRILMHRLILGVSDPAVKVDHINHNGIDNRRCNIRLCTHQENMMNRKKTDKPTTSKYLGVRLKYNKTRKGNISGPFIYSEIKASGQKFHLGYFKTQEQAAKAYDIKAKELFGEFANLNFKE